MKHRNLLMIVVLILAAVQLSGCGVAPIATKAHTSPPAGITPIPGGDLHHIVLTQQAFDRIGIATAPVREAAVTRKRIVGGLVDAAAPTGATGQANPGDVWVRVPLSAGDLNKVDRSQAARVLSLEGDATGTPAQPAGSAPKGANTELYYLINSANHGLAAGQRVRVELALAGGGAQRKIIPYAAVIYDTSSQAWVYTTAAALTYVRHPITVEYIEGDRAILTDGPAASTPVVTVGGAELFGTEFGVGH
jgi:hypothetical protein